MRRNIVTATVLSLGLVVGAAALPAQGSVRVTPDSLRIEIPIGRSVEGLWRWRAAETSPGMAEYIWTATLDGDSTHSIGFMLFKFGEGPASEGSFAELLRAGQSNVSVVVGHRSQVIRRARPRLRGVDSLLVIEFADAALIDTMFARRPAAAMLHAQSPVAELRRHRVPITYVGR